jgi:hypothetical protein
MIASRGILKANFVIEFELKANRKRCCKKLADNYNAIPSLNIDCQNK